MTHRVQVRREENYWYGRKVHSLCRNADHGKEAWGSRFAVCRYNYSHGQEKPEMSSTAYFPVTGSTILHAGIGWFRKSAQAVVDAALFADLAQKFEPDQRGHDLGCGNSGRGGNIVDRCIAFRQKLHNPCGFRRKRRIRLFLEKLFRGIFLTQSVSVP